MKKGITLALTIILLFSLSLKGQNREHLVGVRWGYNISNVTFDPAKEHTAIKSTKNYSVLYTYYHDIWGASPYFGFQTGLSFWQTGYKSGNIEEQTDLISLPLVSQFHLDFWKLRVLLNLGGYGGYRLNKTVYDLSGTGDAAGVTGFDDLDNRIEFGIIAGGGFAVVLKPVELQFEANYNYSLSYLYNPRKLNETVPQYTYPNQLIFSVSLMYHIKQR